MCSSDLIKNKKFNSEIKKRKINLAEVLWRREFCNIMREGLNFKREEGSRHAGGKRSKQGNTFVEEGQEGDGAHSVQPYRFVYDIAAAAGAVPCELILLVPGVSATAVQHYGTIFCNHGHLSAQQQAGSHCQDHMAGDFDADARIRSAAVLLCTAGHRA